jgi:hypothetical protein
VIAPEETAAPALAAGAAVPIAAAPEPVTAGEEVVAIEAPAEVPIVAAGAALVGAGAVAEPSTAEAVAPEAAVAEGEAVLAMPEPELQAPEEEPGQLGRGAVLAGAGIAAAAVLAHDEEAESTVSEAEAMAPQVEAGAPEAEGRAPGLGAVLAGAGIAAVAAVTHDEEAEPAADAVAVATAEAEAAATRLEGAATEADPEGVGLGVALAGAGVAAAVAAGAESEETEPTPIPESAPEPEPGAPLVEIIEEELPPSADEAGILDSGKAIAAAGLAAVVDEGEQEEVTIGAVVLEPDSPEIQAEAETVTEAAAVEVAPPAAPARQVAWAYDEGTSKVAKAVGVQHTQGVGQVYTGKLREVGITTTAALLRAGSTPKGRKELAEKTGISHKQILKWVNHVDLARIKGISEQYADLLEWAGVDTVPALAQRNADNLLQKLTEVNEARRLVRRLPTLGMVASWIAQAKELPRIVVYK